MLGVHSPNYWVWTKGRLPSSELYTTAKSGQGDQI